MDFKFCLPHVDLVNASESGTAYQCARSAAQLKCRLPAIIILAGPTAVGKSELGLQLAKALCGEIVSADSMQVYRGMDIGTAKPTVFEQAQIPHHMIDVRSIGDPMNVSEFYDEAMACLRSICARGRAAIVVGGSGFYVDALLRGAPSGPPADPFIRAHLDSEMERLGPEILYAQLQKMDPEYAKTITHGDRHKIMRALEIIILTQGKVSEFHRHENHTPEFRFLNYFLHRPRPVLYERINQRCQRMVELGLLQEVKQLVLSGLLENPSAMSAIGYRQSMEFLKGDQTPESFKAFIANFQQASRHYAKRQFTWFRKDSSFEWIDLHAYETECVLERMVMDYQAMI